MTAKCFLQKTLCGLSRNFKRNLPYNTQVKVLCFTLQYAESTYHFFFRKSYATSHQIYRQKTIYGGRYNVLSSILKFLG